MISKEYIVCPYCKTKHLKGIVIGESGLINIFGTKKTITCRTCDKDFICETEVNISYKTTKIVKK